MNNTKEMTLRGVLEERVSKTGKPYTCLVIQLTPTYKKVVFLNDAEKVLASSILTK